jgi:urea transport system ATP-binding protein
MLEVRGVNQFYAESHILWDVDLEVPRGSCTCLMGRNGVGKTTLLNCVLGHLPIRSGSIRLDGAELTGRPVEQRARHGIGYVPQGRMIFPLLTVEENLQVGAGIRRNGASRLGARKSGRVPELVYELFPVLATMARRRGGDLSGGQQQQLAIGRALVLEPELLILDEPCEGIQPNVVHEIGEVIVRLNRELGLTVLLVEQRLKFVRRVADRFAILDRGRVVADGAMDELGDDLVARHLTV